MVDIQSVAAEIRRGIKKEEDRRSKETTGQKYNGLTIITANMQSETAFQVVIN